VVVKLPDPAVAVSDLAIKTHVRISLPSDLSIEYLSSDFFVQRELLDELGVVPTHVSQLASALRLIVSAVIRKILVLPPSTLKRCRFTYFATMRADSR